MGIGTEPPRWTSQGGRALGSRGKLEVSGAIGAREYCKEDGTGCFTSDDISASENYWANTTANDIYSKNNSRKAKVGIGEIPLT